MVVLGLHDSRNLTIDSWTIFRNISKLIIHPMYNKPSIFNDIALLKLEVCNSHRLISFFGSIFFHFEICFIIFNTQHNSLKVPVVLDGKYIIPACLQGLNEEFDFTNEGK